MAHRRLQRHRLRPALPQLTPRPACSCGRNSPTRPRPAKETPVYCEHCGDTNGENTGVDHDERDCPLLEAVADE